MKRYALVIGIGEYDSPNLGKLSKPANDAKAVAEVLRQRGNFQDVTLLNSTVINKQKVLGRVDYGTLDAELTKFLAQAKTQDALIYFTGHGFTLEESRFVTRGYLATSSCRVKFKDKRVISQEEGFSFDDLNGLVQEANLSSLLMLLDCCHSGFLIEDDLVKKSLLAFSRNNYCLIAACRSLQEAYALKSKNHSVFTETLLDSLLEENARQGIVTALDVFGHIDRELKNSGQEPIFLGMGGAIPVVSYAIAAAVEPDETCPYQGLEAFTEATARFFFGRQTDVEALWQKLEQSAFVPVIGASGSGKSSLVRAGLIPALQQSGTNWTVLEPIKPGEEPLTQLRKPLEELARQLTGKVSLANLLRKAPEGLQPLLEQLPDTARFLLVVDQFEEVFTVCLDEAEQARFIHLVTQVASLPNSRLSVVITMRADFVESCLRYEALKQLIQTQAVYLSPLTGSDLTDAIAKPAEQQGYHLTPALLAEIVKDTREEPGFLPLLQFALTKLWDYRDSQAHALTAEAYVTIGKLAGALDSHADQLYTYSDYIDPQTGEINLSAQQSRSQTEQDWIRAILLRLVRTSEGEKDTRQRQVRSTLVVLAGEKLEEQKQLELVLESLIKGRLLVSEQETIDLAHEALIKGWQRLDGWCQESRELRRLSQRLEAARLEWKKDQQNPNLRPEEKDRNLMMGGLLAEARQYWKELKPYLLHSEQDEAFFHRSDIYEQNQLITLQRALTESKLREEATRALYLLSVRAQTGLELAVQAIGENLAKFPNQLLSTVLDSLYQALNLARTPNLCRGHEDVVESVAFSPDGQMIASGSYDLTIRLWDLQGNPIGKPLVGHRDYVYCVAFSPDGQLIASGSNDKTIRLWDLQGNPIGQSLEGHQDAIFSVAFSPDGQLIASGSNDKTIRLWDLQGKPVGQPLEGHQDAVNSIAFSPDGLTIVSSSNDLTIRLWNLQSNPTERTLVRYEDSIFSVAFSPDGQLIASGSNDKTIRLWDLQGKPIGQPLKGHEAAVFSVAFSPDGQTIASGSSDNTIRLWDLKGNPIGKPLVGHQDYVWTVVFSPDGQTIASGGWDRTICLWDLRSNSVGQPLTGHQDIVNSVAFSPDGQTLASGSNDKTIRLWDLNSGSIGQPLAGHQDIVNSVAFSPDGQTLASGSSDKTIRLWDLNGGSIGQPLAGHQDIVNSVAFSPDGQTLASGSSDKTIRLWDLNGGSIGQPLAGHQDIVNSVAFSPDGQTLASGSSDKTIRLWDLNSGSIGQPLAGHQDIVNSVAFSPDGQTLASGSSDKTIRLWDLNSGSIGQPFWGHEDTIFSVAFSPDGQTILSSSNDKTIRLWDLAGNPIGQPFQRCKSAVRSAVFSPNGILIASSSTDKTIQLWQGNWQGWLGVCCQRLCYHLVSERPELEIITDDPEAVLRSEETTITTTQKACATCQSFAWKNEEGREELAQILRQQGNELARLGKSKLAVGKFRQAATYSQILLPEIEHSEHAKEE